MSELLARMRAQLRVYDSSEDAIFQIGPYLFRPRSSSCTTRRAASGCG